MGKETPHQMVCISFLSSEDDDANVRGYLSFRAVEMVCFVLQWTAHHNNEVNSATLVASQKINNLEILDG